MLKGCETSVFLTCKRPFTRNYDTTKSSVVVSTSANYVGEMVPCPYLEDIGGLRVVIWPKSFMLEQPLPQVNNKIYREGTILTFFVHFFSTSGCKSKTNELKRKWK